MLAILWRLIRSHHSHVYPSTYAVAKASPSSFSNGSTTIGDGDFVVPGDIFEGNPGIQNDSIISSISTIMKSNPYAFLEVKN